MVSQLTVADVRSLLWTYVCPEDQDSARFIPALNQVRERIINSGKWHGTVFDAVFDTSRDYFMLPREGEALLALQVSKHPYSVFSKWYEFLQGGLGGLEDPPPDIGAAIDLGAHFCTLDDIEVSGKLKFACSEATDAGKTVTVYGLDDDGVPMTEEVEFTSPAVAETAGVFASVTGIVFDSSETRDGNITLSVAGTPDVQLSVYSPGETRPQYRRYKLRNTDLTVIGKVKLGYRPLAGENEFVIPGNVGALKLAFQAMAYEDNNDLDGAMKYWQTCFALLNQQLKEHRGSARNIPNLRYFPGGGTSIPSTR